MTTIKHYGYTIVDGVLQLDDLRVRGSLYLMGCIQLTELPDGLSVGGWLQLNGCAALAALPDELSVGESLYLNDCTALTALPDELSVGGSLDLQGCTALTALPDGLSVGRYIFLSEIWLSSNEATLINVPLAHSVRTAAIGRRLGDIVEHWALSWNGMVSQIVESIEEDTEGGLVFTLAPHATTMSQPLAVQKGR